MTRLLPLALLLALTGCKSAPRPPAVVEPTPEPSKKFEQLPTETPVYASRFFPTPTPTSTPTAVPCRPDQIEAPCGLCARRNPPLGDIGDPRVCPAGTYRRVSRGTWYCDPCRTGAAKPKRIGWAAPRATETPKPKPTFVVDLPPALTPGPVEPTPPPLEPSRTVYLWRVIASLTAVVLLVILAWVGKNKPPSAWLVVLLFVLLAPVAHAGGPSIWSSEGLSFTGTTLSDAGTRTPTVGARTEYRLRFLRAQLAVRLDFLAEKDGIDPANPGTYSSIEAFALGSYRLAGPVAVSGIYGVTRPAFGISGETRSTWAAGALLGDRERWVFIGAGVRRAVSDDLSGIAAWRWRIKDRTSFVGDLVAKQPAAERLAYQARVGVAVSLWGRP